MEERLQKIMSAAGIASRRRAEAMILQGRVTVNGRTVTVLGTKADPDRDHIKVDGKLVRQSGRRVYILLNKPRGVISTAHDPQGRTKVGDLVRSRERLYPVGRLDCNSEGLILLTNDGEFARIAAAAGEHLPKVYQVKVRGVPEEFALDRLRGGCRLSGGVRLAPCAIRRMRQDNHAWLEVTLTEGKNREIRRMFESIDHPVTKLRRTRIGFLSDRGLPVGFSRHLKPEEVARVLRLGRDSTLASSGRLSDGRR